jgi:hypothetical protein
MLTELHDALRRLLHEQGQMSPLEVDVRFEAPTRQWIDRLTRPTIDLFLYDLEENADLRATQFQTLRSNGHAERRAPPRRIDLKYMVSGLATDIGDAHRLLWRALVTLLKYPEVPTELLSRELRLPDVPLTTRVAHGGDSPNLLEVWSGLGVDPRPALSYVVIAPLDVDLAIQSPLVLTHSTRYRNTREADAPAGTYVGIAGVVRDAQGRPLADVRVTREGSAREGSLTDTEGMFALHPVPMGGVTLRLERADGTHRTVSVEVPSSSYDLVLE